MEITEIKQQLGIATVLNYYNIAISSNRHCLCPFHTDEKPSLRIYEETNTYHCFGCGKTGDVIQFIQDIESSTKHEAITKAKELISINPQTPTVPKIKKAETIDFEGLFLKMRQCLHRSKKAKEYIENRNIYDVKLEQGYNPGTNFKQLKNCIIFPLKSRENEIVSLYGRSLSRNKNFNIDRICH
jgi:DNA primase